MRAWTGVPGMRKHPTSADDDSRRERFPSRTVRSLFGTFARKSIRHSLFHQRDFGRSISRDSNSDCTLGRGGSSGGAKEAWRIIGRSQRGVPFDGGDRNIVIYKTSRKRRYFLGFESLRSTLKWRTQTVFYRLANSGAVWAELTGIARTSTTSSPNFNKENDQNRSGSDPPAANN